MLSLVRAVGRLLLAAIFVSSGWEVSQRPGGRVQAAANIGVPNPELAVRGNAVAMLLGGLALGLGVFPRLAAALLAATLLPTTYAGHPFWKEPDPQKRAGQRVP